MADIFVSYARTDKARVAPLVTALEAQGWSVWWDPEIPAGQEFDTMIAAELSAAQAVIVVWTPASIVSRWVRGEARIGADRGVLIPVRFDNADLPIDARAIHTIDLDDWKGLAGEAVFQAVLRALTPLLKSKSSARPKPAEKTRPAGPSICVLPFVNMSGDPEQEYFSDGISEDVITDLSKVSSLTVASRNSAFAYKGKQTNLSQVARELHVSHVLEGSVRRSGNRVRITAQLIDGATNNHIWAERYDRDLNDIFALQDEISEAIVAALKLRLLPEERKAIEKRGTANPEAYKLYLMARQYAVSGSERHIPIVIRLCRKALEFDPNYGLAWALLANALENQHRSGGSSETGLEAAKRALELGPDLAEAHAAMGVLLIALGRSDEALIENEIALRLDPESYDANRAMGRTCIQLRRFKDGIHYMEKAASLMETDYHSQAMTLQCYQALGDAEGAKDAAWHALQRIEKIVAVHPDHGSALGHGAGILAVLGERERAKEWAARALIVDPDNQNMRYNLACAMVLLGENDKAIDLLDVLFERVKQEVLLWAKSDSDLDPLRDMPRYKALIAKTEARLADSQGAKVPD